MRFAVLIEQTGLAEYEDRVYVFPYPDLDNVLDQAERIGRSHEHQYVNLDGNQVRFKLAHILKVMIVSLEINGDIQLKAGRLAK
jgi:hypothetical protein